MKKFTNQKRSGGITKTKTIGNKKIPRVTIATVSLFSIAVLVISSISPVIAYVQSVPPQAKALTLARHQLLRRFQPPIEKGLLFTGLFLYLYIALLHFIVIVAQSFPIQNFHLLFSLIASLLWPIIDIYGAFAIIVVFIILFLLDIPELPHQNIRNFLSQIHST
jgi:hypothetical protein